jgi:hypothetical protein
MDIHGEKGPGPDGFVGLFFKSCWEIIKKDVVQPCSNCTVLGEINGTY